MASKVWKEVVDKISEIHAAFGAPGNYGYESPEGKALFALYKLQAQLCSAINEERRGQWRIVETPITPKGVFGIETNDPEAVEKNEEVILYPCLTREKAELIVRAHNGSAPTVP